MTDWEVITGDCLEVLPTIAAGSIDAIITDIPYGTTACAWDTVIPFAPMWAAVKHVLKPRGVFVTTASQPFTSALVMSNVKWFRYELVWDKKYGSSPGLARHRPMPSHENVCVFSRNGHTYNPQMRAGKPYIDIRKNAGAPSKGKNERKLGYKVHGPVINNGTRYPLSVIFVQRYNRPGQHPAEKPVALYEYLIRTYTNEGDTVLDFTCGSGTTGVAAINTGRNFIGVELREDYADIARARCEKAAAQARQLELGLP